MVVIEGGDCGWWWCMVVVIVGSNVVNVVGGAS